VVPGSVREHRLLERRERPRLDDIGRERPRHAGCDQGRKPARQREYRSGAGHENEKQAIGAATAEPVAVPGEEYGGKRVSDEKRGEDHTYDGVRVPTFRERDADQHRAQAVRESARALHRDDASCVVCQARSLMAAALRSTSALHQA